MKIKKSQVENLIKEEMEKILEENFDPNTGAPSTPKGVQICLNNPACIGRIKPALGVFIKKLNAGLKQVDGELANVMTNVITTVMIQGRGVDLPEKERLSIILEIIKSNSKNVVPQEQDAQEEPQEKAPGKKKKKKKKYSAETIRKFKDLIDRKEKAGKTKMAAAYRARLNQMEQEG